MTDNLNDWSTWGRLGRKDRDKIPRLLRFCFDISESKVSFSDRVSMKRIVQMFAFGQCMFAPLVALQGSEE